METPGRPNFPDDSQGWYQQKSTVIVIQRPKEVTVPFTTSELIFTTSELIFRLMNEGRCDVRVKDRVEESKFLTYTGLHDKTN